LLIGILGMHMCRVAALFAATSNSRLHARSAANRMRGR
jgi:hypothetical protein